MCMSLVPARCRDLWHQKLPKHPQNPYSIERGDRKRSKTPSHALIDAAGGPHHHFECATRALSGPSRAKLDRAAHPSLIRGSKFCDLGANFGSRFFFQSDGVCHLLHPDSARAAGQRTQSDTYCIDQVVRRRFGTLTVSPFDRVSVLRVFGQLLVPQIAVRRWYKAHTHA